MPNSYLGFSDSRKFGTRHGNIQRKNAPKCACDSPIPYGSYFHSLHFPQRAIPWPSLEPRSAHSSGLATLRVKDGEMPHAGRQAGLGHLGKEFQGQQRPYWCLALLRSGETTGAAEWGPPKLEHRAWAPLARVWGGHWWEPSPAATQAFNRDSCLE